MNFSPTQENWRNPWRESICKCDTYNNLCLKLLTENLTAEKYQPYHYFTVSGFFSAIFSINHMVRYPEIIRTTAIITSEDNESGRNL